MTTKYYLLAGDIGGTNSRLELHSITTTSEEEKEKPKSVFVKTYANDQCLSSSSSSSKIEEDIVEPFLSEYFSQQQPDTTDIEIVACFACAGPVSNNRVKMTNIGGHPSDEHPNELVIDGEVMECYDEKEGMYVSKIKKCTIINDFVGLGYGALDLNMEEEVVDLNNGSGSSSNNEGPKVCVGAGTGLGECFLTNNGNGFYVCYPSEGGHVDYSPRNDLEWKLLSFLKERFGSATRVSVERVISGRGLANVYEFLCEEFPDEVDGVVKERFEKAGDLQGKIVSEGAGEGDGLCQKAMEIVFGAYGAEVGNAALKWIPTGGLYVTGGLTPKNMSYIQGSDSPFMKAYRDKGRVSPILDSIPLYAVLAEDLGLRGSRVCASKEFNQYIKSK